ncbi:Fc.00g105830.m01.CDS01 [Cosmosporella sp. VM-42]
MAAYKNIAIFGASGNVGSIILSGLVASSKFKITVLSRKESEATFAANITVRKTDFTEDDLEAALQDQDVVISALGAAAFGEQQKIVDAALRAGVKRFIPSEFSTSSEDAAVLQLLPLFGQKKALIEYLQSKQSEGLTWTGIATGGLFDWDGGNKRFTLINEKQLSQAVVSVLEHPKETSNQYIYVYSVETSQNEILESLEEVTGTKWSVNSTTTEEQVSGGMKKLNAGDFSGAFALVRATCYGNSPGVQANYTKLPNLANKVLGLKIDTVQNTVKRVLGK